MTHCRAPSPRPSQSHQIGQPGATRWYQAIGISGGIGALGAVDAVLQLPGPVETALGAVAAVVVLVLSGVLSAVLLVTAWGWLALALAWTIDRCDEVRDRGVASWRELPGRLVREPGGAACHEDRAPPPREEE